MMYLELARLIGTILCIWNGNSVTFVQAKSNLNYGAIRKQSVTQNVSIRKPWFLIPKGGSTVAKKVREESSSYFAQSDANTCNGTVYSGTPHTLFNDTVAISDLDEELANYGHMFVTKRDGSMERLDKAKVNDLYIITS